MVLSDDRSELDAALNVGFRICVLRGAEASVPGSVHDCLEGDWGPQPWYRWFLITNPSLLTANETSKWFGNNPDTDYAFLGRWTRAATSSGSAQDDLLDGGECDNFSYIDKFAEADLR